VFCASILSFRRGHLAAEELQSAKKEKHTRERNIEQEERRRCHVVLYETH